MEETILLENINQIEGINDRIGDFRLKIIKKDHSIYLTNKGLKEIIYERTFRASKKGKWC